MRGLLKGVCSSDTPESLVLDERMVGRREEPGSMWYLRERVNRLMLRGEVLIQR